MATCWINSALRANFATLNTLGKNHAPRLAVFGAPLCQFFARSVLVKVVVSVLVKVVVSAVASIVVSIFVASFSNAFAHAGHDIQLERLNNAIAEAPLSQHLYIERAALLTQAHRFDDAEADFVRAEKLGAPFATAYQRGLFYEARGEYAQAHAALSRYLKHSSRSHYALEARARVAQALGDTKAAVSDLRKNLALTAQPNPGNYIAAANLLEGLGETGSALAILDEGLNTLGVIPSLQRAAITIEQQRNNFSGAIARLETLRKPLRESAQWKLDMATLLTTAEKWEQATHVINGLEADLRKRRPTPSRARLLEAVKNLRDELAHKQAAASKPME